MRNTNNHFSCCKARADHYFISFVDFLQHKLKGLKLCVLQASSNNDVIIIMILMSCLKPSRNTVPIYRFLIKTCFCELNVYDGWPFVSMKYGLQMA